MSALAALLGESDAIAAVRQRIERLIRQHADSRRFPPILIQGETGTGKGLLARSLHQASPRRDGPFVDVNCAAIPEHLLESELFGFERGAFTDARQPKPGLVQAAHRGTLFLDELALLPRALQAKLLTVVEERAVRRLGSTRNESVDFWIVAATSDDLLTAVQEGRFHEALYHRLSVLTFSLPPLRERGADVVLLTDHFLARACADHHLGPRTLTVEARAALSAYRWPGNVRELINAMERAALTSRTPLVGPEDLGLSPGRVVDRPRKPPALLRETVGDVEREHLLAALTESQWIVTHAAARLGLPPNTLRYRMKKYGLQAPPGTSAPVPDAPIDTPPAPLWLDGVRWADRELAVVRAELADRAGSALAEHSRAVVSVALKVQSFGGRLEELGQSAIVAVFGIEQVEDAARRAANSALSMLKEVERAAAQDDATWVARVGLHVSQSRVGIAGGASFIDADAKRQLWAIVERLSAGTASNTIALSAAAASSLRRHFELERVDGSSERVYRLVGGERANFALPGRKTDFIGRAEELQLLRSRLDAARRGHGQVVGIGGDAGVGKSRLLFEFHQRAANGDVTYLESRCQSYADAIPYFPVDAIVRDTCRIAESDPVDVVTAKIHQRLQDAGADPADGAPCLLRLLGVGPRTGQSISPDVLRAKTFETLRRLISSEAGRRPVILAVEDLHWVDPTSEEFLISLANHLSNAPILLLVTYRSGYRPSWLDRSYATQIALPPLSPAESHALISSALHARPAPADLISEILKRAEGNPFFLEELAFAVVDEEVAAAPRAIPDTIQGVLRTRMARLPADDQHLLQCASVIGREVPMALLRAVAGIEGGAAAQGVGRFQAAELMTEARAGSEAAYLFKHALTQDVAYSTLPGAQVAIIHAEVMRRIERIYADRLEEWVEQLARHARAGEVWNRAAEYARRAGNKAAAQSAYAEAVVFFDHALDALGRLPASRQRLEDSIDIRLELRAALTALTRFDRLQDCLRDALADAETLGDPRRLAVLLGSTMIADWYRGDAFRGVAVGQRAVAIARAMGDSDVWIATAGGLGINYHALGDYDSAIDLLEQVVEHPQGDIRLGGTAPASVMCRTYLAWCLAERGEFRRGLSRSDEALRIAETIQQPYATVTACWGCAILDLRRGELSSALAVLERGLAQCESAGIASWLPAFAAGLGYARALTGRVDEALAPVQLAVDRSSRANRVSEALWLGWLGETYLLAGRIGDAAMTARRSLDMARQRRGRGHEAWALRLLGEIASHPECSDHEAAEGHYREAIALGAELGMRPLIAHCHRGLGQLRRQRGSREEADVHLAAATAMFQEMEMGTWWDGPAGNTEQMRKAR